MGGNALNVPVKRLLAIDFKEFENEVCQILKTKFKDLKPTLYYKNKEDFGDLDIIVIKNNELNNQDLERFLKSEFNTKDIYFNSDVVSFEYKDFQVDLIFMSEEDFETSHFYYSYNDLNNLVGRIAHKLGLKFGFDGLTYVLRDEKGSQKNKYVICKEPRLIYEFLDLDYDKYLQGFDDLEDIFNFVVASKYFNADIFNYENLNHQNRTRNRKRKTYAYFLEWLTTQNIQSNYTFEDKDFYISDIEEYFNYPLHKKIDEFNLFLQNKKMLSEKFNGKLIQKIILRKYTKVIEGAELGKFISNFKNHIKDFDSYLNKRLSADIETDIIEFYSHLAKNNKK